MDHFQCIVALTRIMSAVLRKGGDVTFLVEEKRAVFGPKGGYFKAGVYMPSLVAELGTIVQDNLKSIGTMRDPEMGVKLPTADQRKVAGVNLDTLRPSGDVAKLLEAIRGATSGSAPAPRVA